MTLTPKDKAEDLFMMYVNKGMSQIKPVINRVIRKEMAKQCALIAVDEILELLPEIAFGNRVIKFYEQVKQEIEKL